MQPVKQFYFLDYKNATTVLSVLSLIGSPNYSDPSQFYIST